MIKKLIKRVFGKKVEPEICSSKIPEAYMCKGLEERNAILVSSERPEIYIHGVGGYDGLDKDNACTLQTALSGMYVKYVPDEESHTKEEMSDLLGISPGEVDVLLSGSVRSVKFQYRDSVYNLPFSGSMILGDEVDTYGIYEIPSHAVSCILYAPYYMTFIIHKDDTGMYDCKFIIRESKKE